MASKLAGLGLILALTFGSVAMAWFEAAEGRPPAGEQARNMITPATQEAIDMGLEYLAKHQRTDGSWGTGQHQGNIAITSVAGLAFMAGGHQPGRGKFGKNVTGRPLDYVLRQDRDSCLGVPAPGFLYSHTATMHGPMYGHGSGTLFLAEAQGMAANKELKDRLRTTLQRATKLIIDTQNGEGGWRYRPQKQDADISVTICQIMALRAARNAGLAVPKSVADKCTEYVKDCQDIHRDGGFRYMKQVGPTGFARTAAGVVALYSAGVYTGPAVEKGLEYLMRNCKPGLGRHLNNDSAFHYYYGHYYAAQAMWIAGGRHWQEWFPAIRDDLLRPNGDRNTTEGSWSDRRICPHYCTAMACIILQIPNNYLPIFQR